MDAQLWSRVQQLFESALAAEPSARPALLERCCGSDAALRGEVESLLAAAERDHAFLETPACTIEYSRGAPYETPSRAGTRIGRYEIISLLGSGGSSAVYEAEQDLPHRRVALKVLRSLPLLDELSRARLDREIRALARLDHPGIARIYDAGVADDGVAFIAMELVTGRHLTDHAQAAALDQTARLALFREVCAAIEYAHQRGVIHLDLKPSNIVVSSAGRAKVLDFGLARVVADDSTRASIVGGAGALCGTLAYMSPERAGESPAAPNVRSDVYSLGAVLFELLSGTPPIALAGATISAALRRIQERPPAPLRIAGRPVDRELAAIVAMALEKSPESRYPSVAALLDDLERLATRRPTRARPVGTWGAIAKFMARNRLATTFVAVLLAVLTTTAIVSTVLARAYSNEYQRAEQALSDELAAREAAQETAAFLESLFTEASPDAAGATEPTLRDVLGRGVEKLDNIHGQPLIEARLARALGLVYGRLNDFERAEELTRRALAIYSSEFESAHPDVIGALFAVAEVVGRAGRDAERISLCQRAVDALRECCPTEHERMAQALGELGAAYFYSGENAQAEPIFTEALKLWRQLHPEPHPDLGEGLNNLGFTLVNLGRAAEAEPLLLERAENARALGDLAQAESALNALSHAAFERRDVAAAVAHARAALEIGRRIYHESHPRLAFLLREFAFLVRSGGDLLRAANAYEEALAVLRQAYPGAHNEVAATLNDYGMCLADLLRLDEATERLHECVTMRMALQGPTHPVAGVTAANLASLYLRTARPNDAEEWARVAVAAAETVAKPGARSVNPLCMLGNALLAQGRVDEAHELFERALTCARENDVGWEWIPLNSLGSWAISRGDFEHAREYYEASLLRIEANRNPPNSGSASVLANLGIALRLLDQSDASGLALERAVEQLRRFFQCEDPRLAVSLSALAALRLDQGRLADAERLLDEADMTLPPDLTRGERALQRGRLQRLRNNPAVAADLLAVALIEIEQAPGAGAWRAAIARCELGPALAASGETRAAREALSAGLAALSAELGEDCRFVREARRQLETLEGPPAANAPELRATNSPR